MNEEKPSVAVIHAFFPNISGHVFELRAQTLPPPRGWAGPSDRLWPVCHEQTQHTEARASSGRV